MSDAARNIIIVERSYALNSLITVNSKFGVAPYS